MGMTASSSLTTSQLAESEQARQGPPWYQHLTVLIPILTIYLCLAFYRIDHQSFWVDEVMSLVRADPEGAFLARERWSSGHGPLYFRLLHVWAQGGTSEFALRSLSPLFGAMTVCLTYMMGLQLCNRRVAWIGALLMATSPFLIWFSQEVRYIILMMAASLFAMYAFHRALTAKRLGWWLLHCGSLILAIAAFVVSIFLPLAQGMYLAWSRVGLPVFRKWAASQLVVFTLFIWWANDFQVHQLGGYWQRFLTHVTTSDEQASTVTPEERLVTGGTREFTAMALPYTLFTFSVGFSLGPSVRELQVSRSLPAILPHAPVVLLCGLLFGSLVVLGFASLRRQPESARFLAAWLAVPIIGTLGISALLSEMAYNVRYVAMGFPAYILILSVGIASFRRPLLQMALLSAVLLINGLSLANYYFDPRYSREDARAAARYLEAAAHPGEIIVVVGNVAGLQHYYRGDVPLAILSRELISERPALSEHLHKLDEGHDRLWLVEIRRWETDPQGTVKALLDESYRLSEQKELPGVGIYAYERR